VNHDASRVEGAVNAVKLFCGGQEMDSQPDFIFRPSGEETELYGSQFAYLGDITGDGVDWIAVTSNVFYEQSNRMRECRVYFYQVGSEIDSIPDMVISNDPYNATQLRMSPTCRPSDFNGDGYYDVLLSSRRDNNGYPQILSGGEDFDNIPDWSGSFLGVSPTLCTGGDVNGDGYDDFILNGKTLYLGGDPMDTTALWTFENSDTTDLRLQRFVLFPDVNGDGYDDCRHLGINC